MNARQSRKTILTNILRSLLAASLAIYVIAAPAAQAYAFAYTVADMRLPSAQSGGSACPQPDHWNSSLAGGINRQWSTSLSASPVTIITQATTPAAQLNEIESVISQSFGVWTGVAGTTLLPASLATLARTSTANACSSTDGLNTICFNQSDPAFTTGVLSFTRVTTTDFIGDQPVPNHPPSTFVGEIVDADILLNPTNNSGAFATPNVLAANPQANDLESVLTHELGHFFGFEHTSVWSAIMFPFVPPPGAFDGPRPTLQTPDAPLSDDDRTGLRVLYPNRTDTTHVGTISGRILPANPLSLVNFPGVTGIFAAQVVAVDNTTGLVIAATQAGWSCSNAGPAVFDGSYILQQLPVGISQSYEIYVEPFTGPEDPSDVAGALANLCRNGFTDANWPAQFSCTVPIINTNFTARIRPPG
nr:matrixin family metalloprotease [Candidatus Acidoferrales bacterium]